MDINSYLDKQAETFDVAAIFNPEIDSMDQGFNGTVLYKYYGSVPQKFFENPTIRFTQRLALNDPFEFSQRWKQFSTVVIRKAFVEHLRTSLNGIFDSDELILSGLAQEFSDQGGSLSTQQIEEMRQRLKSPMGAAMVAQLRANFNTQLESVFALLFEMMNQKFSEVTDRVADQLGMFSVSETPVSEQMWGLYANSGKGFCIEFNAQHEFFRTVSGELKNYNLFRKVKYTNDPVDSFWSNPLYFFLVKEEKWEFEREWRMLKKIAQCDHVVTLADGTVLHLSDARKGMISSIIFGYNFDKAGAQAARDLLTKFDSSIAFKRAAVDKLNRRIVISDY